MIGVVLAAGRGSRLRPVTDHLPKALIPIGRRTCLDIVLDALCRVADRIVIVSGYLGERMEHHIAAYPPGRPFQLVHNPKPQEGNLISLATARPFLEEDGFIVANADHLFPEDFYTRHFIDTGEISIAAQSGRRILADEMKIDVNPKGFPIGISKNLTTFSGAYIGATRIPKHRAGAYWNAFEKVRQRKDIERCCVEDVLGELINRGESLDIVWVDPIQWFEIDTHEDLLNARERLS